MNSIKILVIEDSNTDRYLIGEILKKNGYAYSFAVTGEEGVEKSQSEQPDIILMDILMPGMNGFQATRIISSHEKTKHIPIIILTTKEQESDKAWGLRQGAQHYINKPINQKELQEALTDVLQKETALQN